MMRKTPDSTRLDCEKEMERLDTYNSKAWNNDDVKRFENSNEVYYIKIRNTIEEKVYSNLSNSKILK